jgi:5-methylcytosine-specific restriction endonuclease McrA
MVASCPRRQAALAAGETTYFTGKPCSRGHVSPRRTASRACVACASEDQKNESDECRARRREAHRRWLEANPDKMAAAKRSYRERNFEKVRESEAAYRAANPERRKASMRAWYAKNAESQKTKAREYRASNPEAVRHAYTKWEKANPEKRRVINDNRRARKLAAEGRYTPEDVARITKAQKGRCACCKNRHKLTVDHIVPLSKGGSNWPSNLQMLCGSCNSAKKDKDPIAFQRELGRLL